MEDHSKLSKQKAFLLTVIILILLGVVLFVPAGSFQFWEAWIFWMGFAVITLFITIYLRWVLIGLSYLLFFLYQ